MKISFHISYILILAHFMTTSCKKFVQVAPPQNQLVSASVFTTDQVATAAVIGLYSQMMTDFSGFAFANGGITLYTGLTGDEFSNYGNSPDQTQFYENSIQSTNTNLPQLWSNAYNYVFTCNAVLEGLHNANSLSITVKNQLSGEAYFLRAFHYFYLTNLFGELPLVVSTSYQTNQSLAKNSRDLVYQQIITDLEKAIPLLSSDFSFSGGERIRANCWAARALLSRVYLFIGNWQGAASEADTVISNNSLFSLTNLNTVFQANSQESILQFMPVVPEFNTWEGYNFILTDIPSSSPAQVALTANLVGAFEPNDLRRISWIDSITAGGNTYYYPFKYRVQLAQQLTEYYTVLRLAEQFLIRAECKARLNDLPGAVADLNIVRHRAGLPDAAVANLGEFLTAIMQERRVELFCEWGHRWLDLKRTATINEVLSVNKTNWQSMDSLYPIPLADIQNDVHLVQNSGY
jgi:starch-binding outer membrane protein, SusD/RagB family